MGSCQCIGTYIGSKAAKMFTEALAITIIKFLHNYRSFNCFVGFTEEESKQLLAQWLGKETHELPPQYSEEIIKYCRYGTYCMCVHAEVNTVGAKCPESTLKQATGNTSFLIFAFNIGFFQITH